MAEENIEENNNNNLTAENLEFVNGSVESVSPIPSISQIGKPEPALVKITGELSPSDSVTEYRGFYKGDVYPFGYDITDSFKEYNSDTSLDTSIDNGEYIPFSTGVLVAVMDPSGKMPSGTLGIGSWVFGFPLWQTFSKSDYYDIMGWSTDDTALISVPVYYVIKTFPVTVRLTGEGSSDGFYKAKEQVWDGSKFTDKSGGLIFDSDMAEEDRPYGFPDILETNRLTDLSTGTDGMIVQVSPMVVEEEEEGFLVEFGYVFQAGGGGGTKTYLAKTTGSTTADIYANGYDEPATETDVSLDVLNIGIGQSLDVGTKIVVSKQPTGYTAG